MEVPLQAFSSTVRDLYALAEYATPDQFLTQAIGLLQTWIRFDGALFGTGESSRHKALKQFSDEGNAHQQAHELPPQFMASDTQFSADPVAFGFRNAPSAPSRGAIHEIYRKRKGQEAHDKNHTAKLKSGKLKLTDELGLCHLIIHGDDPEKVRPARWIVLYRRHDVRFAHTDAACLQGLWVHLSRALNINHDRALSRQVKSQEEHIVSGLITMQGTIDIADPKFFELLEREWPDLAPESIPEVALECLRSGQPYRGLQIEISMVRQHGFNLCQIRSIDAMEVLTPREFVVARRFAAGMSHKQIARELGVSHHTVRNQLAHLYRKLKLHDKASLAQYLITNAVPG